MSSICLGIISRVDSSNVLMAFSSSEKISLQFINSRQLAMSDQLNNTIM